MHVYYVNIMNDVYDKSLYGNVIYCQNAYTITFLVLLNNYFLFFKLKIQMPIGTKEYNDAVLILNQSILIILKTNFRLTFIYLKQEYSEKDKRIVLINLTVMKS